MSARPTTATALDWPLPMGAPGEAKTPSAAAGIEADAILRDEHNSAPPDSLPLAHVGEPLDELSDLISVLADGRDESGQESSVDRVFRLLGA